MNSTKAQQQYQKAKWAALIKDQQQSPLKVKDWLQANDVSRDQFYYWKRKLKDEILDNYISDFVELPTILILRYTAVRNIHSQLSFGMV